MLLYFFLQFRIFIKLIKSKLILFYFIPYVFCIIREIIYLNSSIEYAHFLAFLTLVMSRDEFWKSSSLHFIFNMIA